MMLYPGCGPYYSALWRIERRRRLVRKLGRGAVLALAGLLICLPAVWPGF